MFCLDEGENHSPSVNGGAKKGRGRPPKSPGSVKVTNGSAEPKRGRGRPSKSGENSAPAKKPVVVPTKKTEEAETNGDESKKKRGRPSKSSTPSEQNNVISKPQVSFVDSKKKQILIELFHLLIFLHHYQIIHRI